MDCLTMTVPQTDVWSLLPPRRLSPIYDLWPVSERPAVLDEMMPDITRLINSVAARFSDKTCAHLHYDEMVGECRLKLAEVIHRGELVRQPTRGNFFRFFKTALQNQARSRVQKYRFTEKRTGVKPPPRESRVYTTSESEDDAVHHDTVAVTPEHHKNVELSLDDAELNLQVSSEHSVGVDNTGGHGYREAMRDYEALLTEVEVLVFRQMAEANSTAYYYAYLDACYNRTMAKLQVRVKNTHLAAGLGMAPELFEEAVLSIRQKIQTYRNMTDAERLQEARRSATLAQLKQVFGLQIPPNTDDILVRRLLTIAARDQYVKVKDNLQLAEMLESVGAKVPKMQADGNLACYGVLYQKNQRHCNHCGLRESCAVEAANTGLGKIALSPRLLGARQTRVPAVLPISAEAPVLEAGSADTAEIITYLDENFARSATAKKGEIYFKLSSDNAENRSFLFCAEGTEGQVRLRFCNPSENLKQRLEGDKRRWYAPSTASVQDVVSLIDQHAKDSMEGVTSG